MQQNPTLSNTAEIVENERPVHLTPLLLNKERFLGLSKITNKYNKNLDLFIRHSKTVSDSGVDKFD